MKKQILYPDFYGRIFSTTMDLVILAFLISIIEPLIRQPFCMWLLQEIISKNHLDPSNYQALNEFFKSYTPLNASDAKSILLCQISTPVIQLVLLATYIIFFYFKFGRTPAKFIMRTKIVDQETLQTPTRWQFIKRALASIVYPFGIWFAIFSKRKQTLHDMISNTMIIKS